MSALKNSDPLVELLLQLGDNALVLSQRISEWCGHSPELEEDIAMSNIALDLIGHAQYWLGLAGEIEGQGRSADDLSFLRDGYDFRNLLLVEQPNGDYGHTIMRNFFFDGYYLLFLRELKTSSEQRIAEIAAKVINEVSYHFDRSSSLVIRLGDGTRESHDRMQDSLDRLWSYTGEMFVDHEVDIQNAQASHAPLPSSLKEAWLALVDDVLLEATLVRPDSEFYHEGGRQGRHTEHLGHILTELQWLQRSYPGAQW